MAKKVFRVHSGHGSTNSDWFTSNDINAKLIDKIDTDGGDGKKLPTSIPSPFARIDLVRNAFSSVGESKKLDGLTKNGVAVATDNHKLISDALDIGQILFNFNKHADSLQLLAWDRNVDLGKLINGNAKQKHLGETIKLFLEQDREQYNFDKFDKIYILKYNHKIIGGTSPRTLFFAAPDAKPTNIKFGQDTMLDEHLLPLYRRDREYVKYLFSITKTTDFNSNFPEFNSYMASTLEKIHELDYNFYGELHALDTNAYLKKMEAVVLNNNAGQPLEIIRGLFMKQFIKDPVIIQNQSDFVIKAKKQINGLTPLVLPVKTLNLSYTYTNDLWSSETVVPVEDNLDLNERTLPGQGDKYPYLTMNDFLEDSIIKLPYSVDDAKFLTVGSSRYLLPIKKEVFNYFTAAEIDGQFISIQERAGESVEVTINIPVKAGIISYSKLYFMPSSVTLKRDPKKGVIIEKPFVLSIFPFVKSENIDIDYTIGFVDIEPNKSESLSLTPYSSVSSEIVKSRNQVRSSSPMYTNQTVVQNRFDSVIFTIDNHSNFVIPKWNGTSGNAGDSYEFAIDFGTTNTHIQYKIQGQGADRPFDITQGEEQIAFLMKKPSEKELRNPMVGDYLEGQDHLIQEVISPHFGDENLRNTPFRTSLVQNVDVNYAQPSFNFSHANIAFDYENIPIRTYLKSYTNLKWAKNSIDDNKRVEHYVNELLMICKNKVLMNNGDLHKTKVTWFYPVSMTSSHLGLFRRVWAEGFEKVFNTADENLIDYPESIAPFYFYKAKEGIATADKPTVSFDIGGGTTDVMIYANGKPQLITSFKFAGNSIFGDGFNGNISSNGFVQTFKGQFFDVLKQNDLNLELDILNQVFSKYESSTDVINFFFSLASNKRVLDKQLDLDFAKMLSNNEGFKIIFLLFYSSIVYHVADLMKIKGIEMPRNIVFSGTASKTLRIIDSSPKLSSLTELCENIFNKVFHADDARITIKSDKNPKEVTSKGGFYIDPDLIGLKHNKLVEVNLGNLESPKVQNMGNHSDTSITFKEVDDAYLKGVILNVNEFYELFKELSLKMNFKDEFGVSQKSLEIFDRVKTDDQLNYLKEGFNSLKQEVSDNELVGETFFFNPIIGLMYHLAHEISEN